MSKRVDQKNAARMVREQIAREQRRKRTLWISVAAGLGLVIVGLIGWGIYAGNKNTEVQTPTSANASGVAFSDGTGPVTVEEYVDFLCPNCKNFHDEASDELRRLVEDGTITLVTHPVAILDRLSSNQYSTRSAAASACAADEGRFAEYTDVLFTNQPAEGGPGPDNEQLIGFGNQVGLGEPFAQCVRDGRYTGWVGDVTEAMSRANITGTPTVLVNGQRVQASSAAILAAVSAAGGAGTTPSNPTPSMS
jgi:protein-disulfide isomerase